MPDVLVRHDWTYRELQRLATMAARRTTAMDDDFAEKTDIAMLALVEMLWAADESPDQWELVDGASDAVRAHVRRDMSVHGKTKWNEPAPHHATYWNDHTAHPEPVTERIVESIALQQVFTGLDDKDRDILWTRAMFTLSSEAAAALGIARSQFTREHSAARRRATRLWFGEQTPRPYTGRDRRVTTEGASYRMAARQRIARAVGKK